MKQATTLVCKETFAFKNGGKGRAITFKAGQRFWVTNSEAGQKIDGVINVARAGMNSACGYNFTAEQVAQKFTEVG